MPTRPPAPKSPAWPTLAWIVLGLLLLVSFGIDLDNSLQGGAIDLRNRITGARLLADGLDPYFYKWHVPEPARYADPHNNPFLPVSKTTVTPAMLALHLPLALLPYRAAQLGWLALQWLFLLGTGWLWLRCCATARQRFLLAAFIVGFTYTAAWRLHAERGQSYVLLVFIFAAWLAGTLKNSPKNSWWTGLLAGLLVAFRPPFLVLAPFLLLHRRRQLPGAAIGLLLGFVLPLFWRGDAWTKYSAAMNANASLYLDAATVPFPPQEFPPAIEGMPTDLLGNFAPIPFADFSLHHVLGQCGWDNFPTWPPLLAIAAGFLAWLWRSRHGEMPYLLLGLAAWFFLLDLCLPAFPQQLQRCPRPQRRRARIDRLRPRPDSLGRPPLLRGAPARLGRRVVHSGKRLSHQPAQPSFHGGRRTASFLVQLPGHWPQGERGMLNFIWLGLIGLALLLGGFSGHIDVVGAAAIDSARKAVDLAIGLIGIVTLWLGLMRLAEKAGLVHRLGLALKPIMRWLFPEVPADHPAMGAIILNVAANILGLNNAATPLGLRAMQELQRLNRRPGVATNAMCMLLAINTSSITLIPVTVIGLLMIAHGKNPTAIIGTSLVATAIAHAAAILACKALERSPFYRLPPLPAATSAANLADPSLEQTESSPNTPDAGRQIQEEVSTGDATLPWVPGSKWILSAVAGLFLAMWIFTAFPDHFPHGTPLIDIHHDAPLRLVEAISLLAIPWLLLFFPLYAALRRIPVYEEFVEGAREGFNVILRILPYIVGMLVATGMFSAAGGMKLIADWTRPVTSLIHFPAELVPLALIRPFSGSASLPLLQDIINRFGPDSFLALTAGTMYGCSETTFYVIAVYFGSVGIRKTRHAIPAGIVADIIGPIASVFICRAVFG